MDKLSASTIYQELTLIRPTGLLVIPLKAGIQWTRRRVAGLNDKERVIGGCADAYLPYEPSSADDHKEDQIICSR